MKHDFEQYDIEVELTLVPSEEEGRRAPLYSGYRAGHIYLDGIEWIASFDLKEDRLYPGQFGLAWVTFFYMPQCLIGRLELGKKFLLIEGTSVIGSGVITAFLNFERHAAMAQQMYGDCRDTSINQQKTP